jgi:transcriptional regulator with XRE-family HTH domain
MLELLECQFMPQDLDREKIRARRKELGLNQTEAADRADIASAQVWSDIESGRRDNITLATLLKIAAALECDARDIITPAEKKSRKGK